MNVSLRTIDGLSLRDNAMKLGLINSAWAQTGRETSYGIRKTK